MQINHVFVWERLFLIQSLSCLFYKIGKLAQVISEGLSISKIWT